MTPVRELYVYYRVAAASAIAARSQVAALHAELRTFEPQLRVRLLVRPASGTDEQTWMETYAIAADQGSGIDAELQAGIEDRANRLLTAISGPRHVEVFEVCQDD